MHRSGHEHLQIQPPVSLLSKQVNTASNTATETCSSQAYEELFPGNALRGSLLSRKITFGSGEYGAKVQYEGPIDRAAFGIQARNGRKHLKLHAYHASIARLQPALLIKPEHPQAIEMKNMERDFLRPWRL